MGDFYRPPQLCLAHARPPFSNFVGVLCGGSYFTPATTIFSHPPTYLFAIAVADAFCRPSHFSMTLSNPLPPCPSCNLSNLIHPEKNLSPPLSRFAETANIMASPLIMDTKERIMHVTHITLNLWLIIHMTYIIIRARGQGVCYTTCC